MRLYHIPRIFAVALVLALFAGGYSLTAGETAGDCVPGSCPDNVKCVPCPAPPSGCCATMGKIDGASTNLKMVGANSGLVTVKPAVAGAVTTSKAVNASTTVECKPSADCVPAPGCCAGSTKGTQATSTAAKTVQGEA